MAFHNDLTGKKFGMLTVIGYDENEKKWMCECECGNKKLVETRFLNNGNTKSCGCLKKIKILKLNETKKKINNISEENSSTLIIHSSNSDDKILIDKEDYEIVKKYYWRIDRSGYVVSSIYNEKTDRYNKLLKLHRLIMNAPDGMVVDHIDGNKLNNHKCNLRICTQAENTRNRGIASNSSTGVTGVRWNKINKTWRVMISDKNIGSYKNFEDAVKARKQAEKEYFGEFARKD